MTEKSLNSEKIKYSLEEIKSSGSFLMDLANEDGINDYMSKPININKLLGILAKYMRI